MPKARKATIQLSMFQLAYGIRACDHLAEAYRAGINAHNPQVAAANKATVTALEKMSKLFSKELGKLQPRRARTKERVNKRE